MDEIGKVLVTVLVLYVVLTGFLFVIQRKMIYSPDPSPPSMQRGGVAGMEAVTLRTEDGLELLSWYSAARDGQPTIAFFHGNAGNIEVRGFKARAFMDAGIGVLLVEYRGYGGNAGDPTEEGLYQDGHAALAFLAERGVSRRETVLYGESLGSGVAVHLAWEAARTEPVGGVVLEAPFTSLGDVAQHHYFYLPARKLLRERYDSAAKIGHIKAPVLVVHGEADRTVPVEFGRRIFELAREPKRGAWFPGYGHNDLFVASVGAEIIAFIKEFVETD